MTTYPDLAATPTVDADDETPAGLGTDACGAVLVRLGSGRYAVPMTDVAEVVPVPGVTRVPDAPAWLVGVANWRGRILAVLDVRPVLHVEPRALPSSARLLVLVRDELVAGVVAEAVPGVFDGELSALAPTPGTVPAEAARLLAGETTDPHGPVAVLDTAAVFALRAHLDRRRTSA